MDYGLFRVRFLFLDTKKERCSIDESFIYGTTLLDFSGMQFIFSQILSG